VSKQSDRASAAEELVRRIQAFDDEQSEALRRIWFLGDVHGEFRHIVRCLAAAPVKPAWLVFLGDLDLEVRPLRDWVEPLRSAYPGVQVAFIHGNHDADTHGHWERLHNCGSAVRLHGQVLDLDGVRVAGLGGVFMGRVWSPPAEAHVRHRRQLDPALMTAFEKRERRSPKLTGAIYPDEWERLSRQRADILVTHEAPSCHPHGFEAIDELARAMGAIRSFHGHHHDDRSDEYVARRDALGFDARAVAFCAIKNGLGEVILQGESGW
jgi:Icc-related predicted phosphoesterase